jgi:deoxyxylulose-5-phosphate synthase
MQGLKIVFGIDRAGFVGADGQSHHGVFDAAFINTIPDITVFAPATFNELERAFTRALYECSGPVAVRYPRGVNTVIPEDFREEFGDYDIYGDKSRDIAIVTYDISLSSFKMGQTLYMFRVGNTVYSVTLTEAVEDLTFVRSVFNSLTLK